MPKTYLLSRTLDPLLGVFTGFLAYYLHETNPRTAPPPGHTLRDLLAWQWDASAAKREAQAAAASAADAQEMEAMRREIEVEDAAVSAAAAAVTKAAPPKPAPSAVQTTDRAV